MKIRHLFCRARQRVLSLQPQTHRWVFVCSVKRRDGSEFAEFCPCADSPFAVRVMNGQAELVVKTARGAFVPIKNSWPLGWSYEHFLCRLILGEALGEKSFVQQTRRDGFYFPVSPALAKRLDSHFPPQVLALFQ